MKKIKLYQRIVSLSLAIVCLILSVLIMPINATEENKDVKEIQGVTIQNLKTKQYLNYDYGTLKNGTPLRVWPWDGSNEQLFSIDKVSGNTYRILTNASSKYAVDVYRGNSKLKAGQQCDIWKAGDDTVAQNIQFYICDDGSYILRMSNNTNLALSASSSKARVKLVKFNKNDNSQKWVFKDANGNNIDITKAVNDNNFVIPSSAYKKTGIVYTIDNEKYYQSKTVRLYNNVESGTMFYVDQQGRVVNNPDILNKCLRLYMFEQFRLNYKDIVAPRINLAQSYYDIYTNICNMEKLGSLVGKAAGIGTGIIASATLKLPINIGEIVIEELTGEISTENIKTIALVQMVRAYSNNTIAYGEILNELTKSQVTDYDVMLTVVDSYIGCEANFAALDYLVGDQVKELSKSSMRKELKKYYDNVIIGFADTIIPDITAVKVTKTLVDGTITVADFAISCGADSIRHKTSANIESDMNWLTTTYNQSHIENFINLSTAETNWNTLVGKTIASIKSNGKYTKWYGTTHNISAAGGYTGQCTWYAFGRFYEVTGVKLKSANNAKRWLSDHKSNKQISILDGGSNITAPSIAVNKTGDYGHVMFIEHVTYDAKGNPQYVYFTECNYDCNGIYNVGKDCVLQKMTYKNFIKQRNPAGYIVAK